MMFQATGMTHNVTVVAPRALTATRAFNGVGEVSVRLTSSSLLLTLDYAFALSRARPFVSDTSGVVLFQYAFRGNEWGPPVDWLDTRSGQYFRGMFQDHAGFRQDLSHLNVSRGTDFTDMFAGTRMAASAADGSRPDEACATHMAFRANPNWDPVAAGFTAGVSDAECP
jgi:hypothetical protein